MNNAHHTLPTEDRDISMCVDCAIVAANDDWTGIDDPDREREIRDGFDAIGGYVVVGGATGVRRQGPCDICGSRLGGDRMTGRVVPND